MADMSKVRLGRADVTLGGSAIGHAKGGVEVTFSPDIHETTVDKHGSSPVKAFLTGMRVEVKLTFAESELADIKEAIAGAILTSGATKDDVGVGSGGGKELTAQTLLIHPTALGAATTHDVLVHKAIVIGSPTLPFKVDEETFFELTFLAIVDESQPAGEELVRIGTSD